MKAFRFVSVAIVASLLAVCSGANSVSLSAGDSIQSQQQQAQQLGASSQSAHQTDTSDKDSIVSAARNLGGNVQVFESSVGYPAPIQGYSTLNSTTPVYQQQQQQQRVYQQQVSFSAPIQQQQSYSNFSKMASVVPQAPLYVSKQVVQQVTVGQPLQQQQQQKYLDTQPEYTQAWADYAHPPGYLPNVYRQVYNGPGIGFGYITWSGPINPQSFYTSVQLPYYYRIPPPSPNYNPAPPSYSPGFAAQPFQAQLIKQHPLRS